MLSPKSPEPKESLPSPCSTEPGQDLRAYQAGESAHRCAEGHHPQTRCPWDSPKSQSWAGQPWSHHMPQFLQPGHPQPSLG